MHEAVSEVVAPLLKVETDDDAMDVDDDAKGETRKAEDL